MNREETKERLDGSLELVFLSWIPASSFCHILPHGDQLFDMGWSFPSRVGEIPESVNPQTRRYILE
jgi:hypothetical protein